LFIATEIIFHSRFEDVAEEPPKTLKRARDAEVEDGHSKPVKSDKKRKLKGDDGIAVPVPEINQDKKQEKKEEKKEKKKKEKQSGKQEPDTGKMPIEREIAGGIKVLDSKIGTGPMAKKGNKVRMRYIGKLQNGKVFDKNVKGNPV
jgi:FK506-binding nuclear protein